jgi:phosphate-selective porin OprO and OprP
LSPIPAHPFSLSRGDWGAFKLVSRYSVADLNAGAALAIPQSVTGGVYGGKQQIYAVGLNWYLNSNMRVMLDYSWIDIDRLDPAGAPIGQQVQAVGMRVQAAH